MNTTGKSEGVEVTVFSTGLSVSLRVQVDAPASELLFGDATAGDSTAASAEHRLGLLSDLAEASTRSALGAHATLAAVHLGWAVKCDERDAGLPPS